MLHLKNKLNRPPLTTMPTPAQFSVFNVHQLCMYQA